MVKGTKSSQCRGRVSRPADSSRLYKGVAGNGVSRPTSLCLTRPTSVLAAVLQPEEVRNCRKCGLEIPRQKLMDIAKLGRIIGHSAHSRKKQSEAMKRHDVAKREWLSMPKPSWPTEKTYAEEIQPRLSTVTIAKIAATLGITEPYRS
jgi:hypothetical protein